MNRRHALSLIAASLAVSACSESKPQFNAIDPTDLDVTVNGVRVCAGGQPDQPRDLVDLTGRAVTITVDLKAGDATATVWTNDLTVAYVHENSAYSS